MKVTKVEEFAKTGPETKWCLTTTDHEQMLMVLPGSVRSRIRRLADKVAEGFEELMCEVYKKQIEAEEKAATEAFKGADLK